MYLFTSSRSLSPSASAYPSHHPPPLHARRTCAALLRTPARADKSAVVWLPARWSLRASFFFFFFLFSSHSRCCGSSHSTVKVFFFFVALRENTAFQYVSTEKNSCCVTICHELNQACPIPIQSVTGAASLRGEYRDCRNG